MTQKINATTSFIWNIAKHASAECKYKSLIMISINHITYHERYIKFIPTSMKLWTIILPCGNPNTNGTLQLAKHLPWEDEQHCFKVSTKLDLNAITNTVYKGYHYDVLQKSLFKVLIKSKTTCHWQQQQFRCNTLVKQTTAETTAIQLQHLWNSSNLMPMAITITAFHGGGKYKTQTIISIS